MINFREKMSWDNLDWKVEEILMNTPARTFLDIGAGNGKYGKMIKKINPDAQMTAIEPVLEYVNHFKLRELYNIVFNCPASKLLNYPAVNHDIVIFGDSIEHMKWSEGMDLLNFLVYRSKLILIKYPDRSIQPPIDGINEESHISVWDHRFDFAKFDFEHFQDDIIHLVVIKGLLN